MGSIKYLNIIGLFMALIIFSCGVEESETSNTDKSNNVCGSNQVMQNGACVPKGSSATAAGTGVTGGGATGITGTGGTGVGGTGQGNSTGSQATGAATSAGTGGGQATAGATTGGSGQGSTGGGASGACTKNEDCPWPALCNSQGQCVGGNSSGTGTTGGSSTGSGAAGSCAACKGSGNQMLDMLSAVMCMQGSAGGGGGLGGALGGILGGGAGGSSGGGCQGGLTCVMNKCVDCGAQDPAAEMQKCGIAPGAGGGGLP